MSPDARLDRLERRCRLLSVTTALLAILVGVTLVGGARSGPSDDVRTKKLTIVNDDDREVGSWVAEKDGSGIVMWDGKGVPRVNLFAVNRSSGLHFHGPDGQSAFNLIERPENWGIKIFGGGKNEQGAGLLAMPGEAMCYVWTADKSADAAGQSRVFMSTTRHRTHLEIERADHSLAITGSDGPFTLHHAHDGTDDHAEVPVRVLIDRAK